MLKLRLSRHGAKGRPYYRIVVADSRSPRDGRFVERIGSYDPMLPSTSENRVCIDIERAKYWLSVGIQPTNPVLRFLNALGLAHRTPRYNAIKMQPGKKMLERTAKKQSRQSGT